MVVDQRTSHSQTNTVSRTRGLKTTNSAVSGIWMEQERRTNFHSKTIYSFYKVGLNNIHFYQLLSSVLLNITFHLMWLLLDFDKLTEDHIMLPTLWLFQPTSAQYLFLLLNLEQLQNTSSQASFFSTVSWSLSAHPWLHSQPTSSPGARGARNLPTRVSILLYIP